MPLPPSELTLPPPPRLCGGFIQYWRPMETWGEDHWHPVLDAMVEAGMIVIVIQQLASEDASGHVEPFMAEGQDATKVILEYATNHGMQVYLGLLFNRLNGSTESKNLDLEDTAQKNINLAKTVATRYGGYPAFTGWYIPLETWTSAPQTYLMTFKPFFQTVSRACKDLANKPVAFSPFVNSLYGSEGEISEVTTTYQAFLTGSGLDILMLQDGVGARNLDPSDVPANAVYFDAMGTACAEAGVEFWANVESFTDYGSDCRTPADPERFKLQRHCIPKAKHAITFDFFHYMNPYIFLKSMDQARQEAMKTLYRAYLEEIMGQ